MSSATLTHPTSLTHPLHSLTGYAHSPATIIDFNQKLIEWSKSENSKFKALLNPDYFMTVKVQSTAILFPWGQKEKRVKINRNDMSKHY